MVYRVILILLFIGGSSFSLTPQEGRQLMRDIAEIKATFKTFMRETDRGFEQINNELNKLVNAGIISFALWDRKTIVSKAKRETIEELRNLLRKEGLL